MNDDLGRHLRDEVPPPRAGYWESIDAALEGIAEETSDTTDTVVRPIGMQERRNDLSSRLLAAAAAVAVIAAAGVFVATRDEGSKTDLAVESTDNPTTTGRPEGTLTTLENTTTTFGMPEVADDVERRCFAGGETAPSMSLVVEFADDGIVRAANIGGPLSVVEQSYGRAFGADGWLVMTSMLPGNPTTQRTAAWFLAEETLTLSEDVWANEIGCGEGGQELAIAAINASLATSPAVGVRALTAGQHCFIDRQGHPGIDSNVINVSSDGTAEFVGQDESGDDVAPLDTGPGYFVTDSELAFDLTSVVDGSENRRTAIFDLDGQVDPGAVGVTFGLGFFNEAVDCTEISPVPN